MTKPQVHLLFLSFFFHDDYYADRASSTATLTNKSQRSSSRSFSRDESLPRAKSMRESDRRSVLSYSKYGDEEEGGSSFKPRSKSFRERSFDFDDDIRSSVSQQRGGLGRTRTNKMPTYSSSGEFYFLFLYTVYVARLIIF